MSEGFVGKNHPQTSKDMEEEVLASGSHQKWRAKIEDFVKSCGADGCNDYAIQEKFGISNQIVASPRGELLRRGVLVDVGRTAPTRKRQGKVWVHKDHI